MEKNAAEILVKVYAGILWVFAILFIFGGLAILVLGPQWLAAQGVKPSMTVPAAAFTLVAVIFLILAAFDIIVGVGIWNLRAWARIPAIIAGVLHLFSFPVGTAAGIFGIWLFGFDEGVREIFAPGAASKTALVKKAPAKKARAKRK